MQITQIDLPGDAPEIIRGMESWEGKDLTCKIPKQMLNSIKKEKLGTDLMNIEDATCEGSLKDAMEKYIRELMESFEGLM